MKLIKFLRSNMFAVIIAILSVIVQSFHSFTAFYNTSALQNAWGIAQAVTFAVVMDLAILFYTVRRRTDIALYAAAAMVTINAYYYYTHWGLTFTFIFGCFLSLIIPVSVYFYSEEIKDETGPDALDALKAQVKVMAERNVLLAKDREEHEVRIKSLLETIAEGKDHAHKLGLGIEWRDNEINSLKAELAKSPADRSLVGIKEEVGQFPGAKRKALSDIPRTDRANKE